MDLTVDAADDNTVFSVFAPGHNLLANVSEGRSWSGTLPAAGDYAIEVASLDGAAHYQLKVWIDATVRDPLGLVQRMSFAPGTDSGTGGGAIVRASAETWVLGAAAGQTMHVSVVSIEANSTFDVFAPDGSRLTAPDERTVWTGHLPHDGDPDVVVQPTFGNATYTITVRITGGETSSPPPPQPPSTDDPAHLFSARHRQPHHQRRHRSRREPSLAGGRSGGADDGAVPRIRWQRHVARRDRP